jgi:hypothetical protein
MFIKITCRHKCILMSKFRFLHIREQDYIRQINCHQHSTEGDVSHSVPVPLFS